MYRAHHGALCQWQCFRCFRHDVQTVANCSVEPLLLLSILSIKSSFIHNIWSLCFSCAHHRMWLNLLSADVEADDLAMTFLKVWQFGLSSYLQSWSQLIYLHHSIGCMTSLLAAVPNCSAVSAFVQASDVSQHTDEITNTACSIRIVTFGQFKPFNFSGKCIVPIPAAFPCCLSPSHGITVVYVLFPLPR